MSADAPLPWQRGCTRAGDGPGSGTTLILPSPEREPVIPCWLKKVLSHATEAEKGKLN